MAHKQRRNLARAGQAQSTPARLARLCCWAKKTLVFVEGQDLFCPVTDTSAQERQANWDAFLAALLRKDDESVRIYWREPKSADEHAHRMDEAQNSAEQVANEVQQHPKQVAAPMHIQEKTYATPVLQQFAKVSMEYPAVENIKRVQIVRLLSGSPPISRSATRTLTVAGKAIDVFEVEASHLT